MKKSLFIAAALLCALNGNAQQSVKAELLQAPKVMKHQIKDMPNQKMERQLVNSPRRAFTNGLYYKLHNALFAGWGADGSGFVVSQYVVPPFVDLTYENMSTDAANTKWYIGSTDSRTDVTEYADESNNYPSNYNPHGFYYTPQLTQGRRSYQFNEDNYWVLEGLNGEKYVANDLSLASTYSEYGEENVPLLMTVADTHGHRQSSDGTNYRNTLSGWGFLSTDFLYGSGSVEVDDQGTMVPAYGFEQTFNPLLGPLCLNSVHVQALTYNDYGPIPEGKTLNAYVMLIDTVAHTSEIIATLEATSKDTLDFKESSPDWGSKDENAHKTAYFGTVVYRNAEKFTDILGNENPLPIAIPAGKIWRIQFEGLSDEGVNLGVMAIYKSDVENSYIDNGYILLEDGHAYTFQNPLVPYISLDAQYEMINVPTSNFLSFESEADFPADAFKGWNDLTVSTDGQTVSTTGLDGTNYNVGAAFVGTSDPWFDEDGLSNYDIDEEELPDWIESIQVDNSMYDGDNLTGYNLVVPVCKPLPTDVKGRQCKINIVGRAGITGNAQLIITQGEYTGEEPWTQGPVVFDFVAAGAAGETVTKANLNFQVNMGEGKEDRTNRDFRGYKDYTGTVLPAECQVALGEEMKFDAEGLIVNQNRYLAIYGLKTGQTVKVWYDGVPEGKTVTFCPGTSVDTKASINGTELVTAVSPIASGDAIKIDQAGELNYIIMSVYSGMHIRQVIIAEDEATGIKNVNNEVKKNNAIFTLAGQRVANPVRGQIYIQNGKKFMVK